MKKLLSVLLVGTMLFMAGCSTKTTEKQETMKQDAEQVETVTTTDDTSQAKEDSNDHYPITITTYNYAKEPVELTFTKAPERVVAIYQSSIETLLALGQGDRIIASAFLDDPIKDIYLSEFNESNYYENRPSKEEIIGMEPDFITSWYSLFGDKVYGDVGFFHERGINTYIQQNSGLKKPNTLENEYEDILNMGKIFDAEDKAEAIVADMKNEINKAREFVDGKDKVATVILEVEKEGNYRIYGEDSIGGNIATSVGANLLADKNGKIGAEDLIALNPDVIFTVYYGDTIVAEQSVNKIMDNPALASINAVANKKVYPIVLSEVYSSGVRTLDGIKTIISGLYPELEQE